MWASQSRSSRAKLCQRLAWRSESNRAAIEHLKRLFFPRVPRLGVAGQAGRPDRLKSWRALVDDFRTLAVACLNPSFPLRGNLPGGIPLLRPD